MAAESNEKPFTKNRTKVNDQISKLEQKRLIAEIEKQEKRKFEIKEQEEARHRKKIKEAAFRAQKRQEIAQKIAERKKNSVNQNLSCAESESLKIAVNMSLLIILIAYFFVFKNHLF